MGGHTKHVKHGNLRRERAYKKMSYSLKMANPAAKARELARKSKEAIARAKHMKKMIAKSLRCKEKAHKADEKAEAWGKRAKAKMHYDEKKHKHALKVQKERGAKEKATKTGKGKELLKKHNAAQRAAREKTAKYNKAKHVRELSKKADEKAEKWGRRAKRNNLRFNRNEKKDMKRVKELYGKQRRVKAAEQRYHDKKQQKTSTWSCKCYLARYADLRKAFGHNCRKAWTHWKRHGRKEHRKGTCSVHAKRKGLHKAEARALQIESDDILKKD